MNPQDGGDKVLWHQPGNFASEASVEFVLMEPWELLQDDYNGENIGDESFYDFSNTSMLVSRTIP